MITMMIVIVMIRAALRDPIQACYVENDNYVDNVSVPEKLSHTCSLFCQVTQACFYHHHHGDDDDEKVDKQKSKVCPTDPKTVFGHGLQQDVALPLPPPSPLPLANKQTCPVSPSLQ